MGRLPVLPVSGDRVHVQTQHVIRGTVSGKDRDWRVLLGCHPLPVLLLALPHSLLPFRGRLEDILKVSEFVGHTPLLHTHQKLLRCNTKAAIIDVTTSSLFCFTEHSRIDLYAAVFVETGLL